MAKIGKTGYMQKKLKIKLDFLHHKQKYTQNGLKTSNVRPKTIRLLDYRQ